MLIILKKNWFISIGMKILKSQLILLFKLKLNTTTITLYVNTLQWFKMDI